MDPVTYKKFLTANTLLGSILNSFNDEIYLPELYQVKTRQDAVMRAVLHNVDVAPAVNLYISSVKELDSAVNGGLDEC